MAKRSQALPYIYGYRKLNNQIAKDLKTIVRKTKEDVLERSLLGLEEIAIRDFSLDKTKVFQGIGLDSIAHAVFPDMVLDARYDELVRVTSLLYIIYLGWADPIKTEILAQFLNSRINAYELGMEDGRRKLLDALDEYDGKYKSDIYKLKKAIRAEELDIPISYRSGMEGYVSGNDYPDVNTGLPKQLAKIIAAILILKTLTPEEKAERIRFEIDNFYQKLAIIITKTKDITYWEIHQGRDIMYYRQQGIPTHQWIVDNPQDTPCIMSANEIVRVGDPFSNGFYWGGTVHKFCHCTTIPKSLDDGYVDFLREKYL